MPLTDDHILFDVSLPGDAKVFSRGACSPKSIRVRHDVVVAIRRTDQAGAPVALQVGSGTHPHSRWLLRTIDGKLFRPLYGSVGRESGPIQSIELDTFKRLMSRQIGFGFDTDPYLPRVPPMLVNWAEFREVMDTGLAEAEATARDLGLHHLLVDDQIYVRVNTIPAWRFSAASDLTLIFDIPDSLRPRGGSPTIHLPAGWNDIDAAGRAIADDLKLSLIASGQHKRPTILVPEPFVLDLDQLLAQDVSRMMFLIGKGQGWTAFPDAVLDAWIAARIAAESLAAGAGDCDEVVHALGAFEEAVRSRCSRPMTFGQADVAKTARASRLLLSARLALTAERRAAAA